MAEIKYKNLYKVIGIFLYYFRYNKTQYWDNDKIDNYQFRDCVNN